MIKLVGFMLLLAEGMMDRGEMGAYSSCWRGTLKNGRHECRVTTTKGFIGVLISRLFSFGSMWLLPCGWERKCHI